MKIHLRGFGVVGAACAWALKNAGFEFTWSDTDSRFTAWRASTGAIYPSACVRDSAAYSSWAEWAQNPPWDIGPVVETADYWYVTKNSPHGMKFACAGEVKTDRGSLRLHAYPSFHLNAQRFVVMTRERFANQRRESISPGERLVVSHGFNARLSRYVWGWTQLVEIDMKRLETSSHRRPCVYLRDGRFVMAYAYPVPGTGAWYAGSTLLVQKEPKQRDTSGDLERWQHRWDKLSGGAAPVVKRIGPIIQGWRPSTGSVAQEPEQPIWKDGADGALEVMPMWHSGVRWLPLVTRGLLERISAENTNG